jgi:hypothetical protein
MCRPDDVHLPEVDTDGEASSAVSLEYVTVDDLRSDDDTTTCLRPLGLCELGGACDACWYRPDHPRFQEKP